MAKFVTSQDAAILGVLYVSKPKGKRRTKLLNALSKDLVELGKRLASMTTIEIT